MCMHVYVWVCAGVSVSLCAVRTRYFPFCIGDPRRYSLYNFYYLGFVCIS